MRTQLLMFFLLLISLTTSAQSISKQVIGSTGSLIVNETYSINFTTGESVVGLVQNNATIHQGFWAFLINDETLSVATASALINEITYYPNPVIDQLTINFTNDISGQYYIAFYDILGKKILSRNLDTNVRQHIINMSSLSKGVYLMRISSITNSFNKTTKIIKN
ncbi:T9SS type A sorting domain-containing protein [uncultured Psychroserpens sp.]|uniref:T9SS type A sorting domain-containing protein n=1 Tax=uncultured Psychroserpens sp. TaxID=255436 RepID=UPI002619AFCF|nr:T9SS type A sorting domain-containing protein [uncultured Psychroserpens sp.]